MSYLGAAIFHEFDDAALACHEPGNFLHGGVLPGGIARLLAASLGQVALPDQQATRHVGVMGDVLTWVKGQKKN